MQWQPLQTWGIQPKISAARGTKNGPQDSARKQGHIEHQQIDDTEGVLHVEQQIKDAYDQAWHYARKTLQWIDTIREKDTLSRSGDHDSDGRNH